MSAPTVAPAPRGATLGGMPGFLVAWLGQVVSVVGSATSAFALGLWVYRETGSATGFAVALVCDFLPGILVAPIAGPLIDRWSRKAVLLAVDTVAGLAMGGIVLAYLTGDLHVYDVYAFDVVASVCVAFQWPAFSAALTGLVGPAQLNRANSLVAVGQAVAELVAPLLAGLLLGFVGLGSVIVFDLVTFVVAVGTMTMVRIAALPHEPRDAPLPLRAQIREGWRYLLARRGLLGLLVVFAVYNFVTGGLTVLITPLVLSFAPIAVLGLIASVGGAGMVAGGVVMSAWGGPARRIPFIFGTAVVAGAVLVVAGLRPGVVTFLLTSFAYFFCLPLINSCSQTIWQLKVAPGVQGRVFSLRRMIAQSCVPISYLLVGALAAPLDHLVRPDRNAALFGAGTGRGAAVLLVCLGVVLVGAVAVGYAQRAVRHVEIDLPDTTSGEPAPRPDALAVGPEEVQS